MQVQITGLAKPGQTPDLTRNGVATGYVVVPEFPTMTTTILMVGGIFGALMIVQRANSRKNGTL